MNKAIFSSTLLTFGIAALYQVSPVKAQEPTPAPDPAQAPPAQALPVQPPAADVTALADAKPPRRYPLLPVTKPFRFQVGGLFPTQDRTRDDINDAVLFVGFTLDLAATRGARPVVFSAYLDGAYGQNDSDPPINRMESLGIGLSARTYFSDDASATRFYVGAGLGAYTVSGKRDRLVDIPAQIGDVRVSRLRYFADDEIRTSFGGKLFAGAEFNRRFFGEVSFVAAGSAQDYSPTGALISAGVRF